ncbi:MAG: class I SAM-dependent methyltransferase [Acidobacteriota bacterium]|nr:MAG: class I SAM-dependent methyltransferase [Acidobacteriota bacterium]
MAHSTSGHGRIESARQRSQFWDRHALGYDRFVAGSGKGYSEMLSLTEAALRPGGRVLEVAAGTGNLALQISPSAERVFATDLSFQMLEIARDKARVQAQVNIDFQVQDALALAFPDAAFDTVICANVLHILSDPKGVLKEVYRTLKPGGQLIAPHYLHGLNFRVQIVSRLLRLIGFRVFHRFDRSSFQELLLTAGFVDVALTLIPGLLPIGFVQCQKRG